MVLFHCEIGGFALFLQSVVLSHFKNRRFCPTFADVTIYFLKFQVLDSNVLKFGNLSRILCFAFFLNGGYALRQKIVD